jgi:ubiquinone/menaquinone biosynthesis C-methylase UbiE
VVREGVAPDATGYPKRMPLFKRKSGPPQATRPAPPKPATRPSPEPPDWRTYDLVASEYARVMAPRMAQPAADMVSLVGVQPGWRLLDVGTGSGVASRAAFEALGGKGTVVGVDVSVQMLHAAREIGGGPHYSAGGAIDLPFRDGWFDAVIGNFVLSHFRKYETALFDMLRVLRSNGRLGVTAWGPGNDAFSDAWTEVAESFAERRIIADARTRAIPWDELFSDVDRLKNVLYDAGLRRIRIERREYRFQMTAEDYLVSREITATGRFLREMLGEGLWQRFRKRSRDVFAERFPPSFNDFRDVNLAVGTKL